MNSEQDKCDFCGDIKPVSRFYINVGNKHFDDNKQGCYSTFITYCDDCGIENNQPVDPQPDETRLTDELDKILSKMAFKCAGGITDDGRKEYTEAKQQILVWHETEKQKLLKQVWNLSQPDIVPEGWKPDTKLGKFLKENIE